MTILFSVHGTPRTNERARHGKGFTYTPAKTRTARDEIVRAYLKAAMHLGVETPHEGPVRMTVEILHAAAEKDLWPGRFCKRKPDLDNVIKLVGDALNGVAYLDDAQIIEVTADKKYGQISGINVGLHLMETIERPKHGKIPHPTTAFCWQVWHHGEFAGVFVMVSGVYQAYDHNAAPLDTYRTQAAAQAAITEHHTTATP